MIEIRRGYNEACARALLDSINSTEALTAHRARTRNRHFYGIYGPDPLGALVVDLPYVHIGVKPRARGRIGFALKAAMQSLLRVAPYLIAPIKSDNGPAIRLAEGLGFCLMFEHQGRRYYWRKSDE